MPFGVYHALVLHSEPVDGLVAKLANRRFNDWRRQPTHCRFETVR